MSLPRFQPHRLGWPWTAEQVESLDSMLEELYGDAEGQNRGLDDVETGDLIYGSATDTLSGLTIGAAGKVLRSDGTLPTWSAFTIPNTFALGDLIYGSAANVLTALTVGAVGKVIRSDGSTPVYSTFTIPDTYAQGDLIYGSAANVLTALPKNTTATRYLSNTGTSNNPAWAQVDLSNGATGALAATNGGTGQTAVAIGDLLYGSALNTWSRLSAGLAGRYLRGGGAGTAPAWSAVILPNSLTNGGIPYADATDQLGGLLTPTQGSIIYGSSSTLWSKLAKDATATRYLANTGTTNNPQWDQVNLANGITGTLPVANGGTGLTGGTSGGILGYTAAGTLASSAALTANALLLGGGAGATPSALGSLGTTTTVLHGNAAGAPTFAAVSLSADVTGDLPFANLVQASGASLLVGRGSAAGAGDFQEIAVGSGLSMSGTTLSATAGGTNALLDGSVHTDTVAQTVSRGSLVYGNATPKWDELVIGSANRLLRSDGTDVSWAQVALATDVSGDLPVANLSNGTHTVVSSTATGTQNNWAPGLDGDTVIFWNGASALTVTGLSGGVSGQTVTFKNVTSGQVATFSNDSGSSDAANRFQNCATSAATPVAAGGHICFQHNGTDWKQIGHEQGTWIASTFAAGDFTASGSMTWTVEAGDVTSPRNAYQLSGKRMVFRFYIVSTTVGGTPDSTLQISNAQFGGFTVTAQTINAVLHLSDNGTQSGGYVTTTASDTILRLRRIDGSNWSAATNNTDVQGTVILEVD